MIADQMAVLNQDYAPSGLQFVLKNTTRMTNWNYFNQAGPATSVQTQMKQEVCMMLSFVVSGGLIRV